MEAARCRGEGFSVASVFLLLRDLDERPVHVRQGRQVRARGVHEPERADSRQQDGDAEPRREPDHCPETNSSRDVRQPEPERVGAHDHERAGGVDDVRCIAERIERGEADERKGQNRNRAPVEPSPGGKHGHDCDPREDRQEDGRRPVRGLGGGLRVDVAERPEVRLDSVLVRERRIVDVGRLPGKPAPHVRAEAAGDERRQQGEERRRQEAGRHESNRSHGPRDRPGVGRHDDEQRDERVGADVLLRRECERGRRASGEEGDPASGAAPALLPDESREKRCEHERLAQRPVGGERNRGAEVRHRRDDDHTGERRDVEAPCDQPREQSRGGERGDHDELDGENLDADQPRRGLGQVDGERSCAVPDVPVKHVAVAHA